MKIRFIVPGEPVGKARPRVFTNKAGKTQAVTPQKTLNYENLVRWVLTNTEGFKPLTGEIEANITAYFKRPKSMTKKDRRLADEGKLNPTKKPDADNICKSILDAANGIAYHDDSYVTVVTVAKKYAEEGEEPRVEVTLTERFEKK